MASVEANDYEVDQLTVEELKSKLEELGHPITGSKAVLRERLRGVLEDANQNTVDDQNKLLDNAQIELMSKAELVRHLRELSLKVTGNKADLRT